MHAGHPGPSGAQHQAAAGHRQPVPVRVAVPMPAAGGRLSARQMLSLIAEG